jgi:hypothetical protein
MTRPERRASTNPASSSTLSFIRTIREANCQGQCPMERKFRHRSKNNRNYHGCTGNIKFFYEISAEARGRACAGRHPISMMAAVFGRAACGAPPCGRGAMARKCSVSGLRINAPGQGELHQRHGDWIARPVQDSVIDAPMAEMPGAAPARALSLPSNGYG